ncbi:MAG TPA: IS1380 family transposase [Gammaproteobacteria bacterium]|nr:IS1380 family transposase [Gammaproteobacteria bacterium]
MTECNRESLDFSRLSRRKISADFDGGRLATDGGGLLLREVNGRLGLTRQLAACIADPRDPEKIIHDTETILAQRICAIALGYEDLNDHDTLRVDPILQVLAEKPPDEEHPLASPATLCRFENSINRESLVRMSQVFVEQFIASYRRAPKKIVLDFDATDDRVHGDQEGKFFHGYYDHYCFLPLYVFCGERLLCAYLRPSNIDPAKHSRAILRLLVNRLRRAWPKTRIVFRADSGFCRWKTLKYCDENDIGYVVGIARNEVLERLAEPFMTQAKKRFRRSGRKQRRFHEVRYAAQTWDRKRRVIVKAEHLPKGSNVRFVVTNLKDTPTKVYDGWYIPRGEMENRIKEQQLGLFADRTSCHKFIANQFRLLLASAAYVLIEHLRRVGLRGTELARAQVSTIRLKLFKIAARVRVSVRRVVLHLSSTYPYQPILRRLVTRLVPD